MAPVKLYVYDLSNGLARQMSRQLTGRQIDGIWCVRERYPGVRLELIVGNETGILPSLCSARKYGTVRVLALRYPGERMYVRLESGAVDCCLRYL